MKSRETKLLHFPSCLRHIARIVTINNYNNNLNYTRSLNNYCVYNLLNFGKEELTAKLKLQFQRITFYISLFPFLLGGPC